MELTDELRNKFEVAVLEAAEKLASEVDVDGKTGYEMEVSFDEFLFYMLVDCTVSNLEEEEETNSRSYNVSIFCTGTPNFNDEDLDCWIYERFHSETIYSEPT